MVDPPNLFILISRCSSASNKDNIKSDVVSSSSEGSRDLAMLSITYNTVAIKGAVSGISAFYIHIITLQEQDIIACHLSPKKWIRMNLVHRDARQIYENQSNDALG